jgi:hypothetical protein
VSILIKGASIQSNNTGCVAGIDAMAEEREPMRHKLHTQDADVPAPNPTSYLMSHEIAKDEKPTSKLQSKRRSDKTENSVLDPEKLHEALEVHDLALNGDSQGGKSRPKPRSKINLQSPKRERRDENPKSEPQSKLSLHYNSPSLKTDEVRYMNLHHKVTVKKKNPSSSQKQSPASRTEDLSGTLHEGILFQSHELAQSENHKPEPQLPASATINFKSDRMLKALKSHESELIHTFLRHQDISILKLAETAKDNELIPPMLLNRLKTLDPTVPKSRAYRYLLFHIYKNFNPDKLAVWWKVLAMYQGTGNVLTQISEHHEIISHGTLASRLNHEDFEKEGYFEEFHIPVLTEILAEYSSKWEEFAVAFWLSSNKIENIRAMKCKPEMALKEVILSWILCEYEHAKPPQMRVLEETMRSTIVGLGSKANKIAEEVQAKYFMPAQTYPVTNLNTCKNITGMISTVCEHITVREGNSVLVETKIKGVRFTWLKDLAIIQKQNNISGNKDAIMYVSAMNLSMEGEYACTVSNEDAKKGQTDFTYHLHVETPLDRYQGLLLDRYTTQREIPEDTWPPSSTGTFISLALIKQGSIHRAGEYSRCTIRGDMDDIYQNKEGITYHRAVSDLSSGDRLLIEGRPGSGKTTLVQKITKDWARGEISMLHVRLLLLIHLRGFFCDPNIGLQDIIRCYFKSLSDIEEIMHYAAVHHGLGFCFVLDGLDEYLPQKGTFIYNLIKKNDLPKSVIIVASRPAAAAKFRHNATRQVEVLGFLKPQISDYIRNYHFSLNSKSQELCKYLDTHPNIYHMCYLPIHACMICFLYDHTSSDLPETETDIYAKFTQFAMLRALYRCDDQANLFIESFDDLPQTHKDHYRTICRLAFEMTLSSKQVMKQADIRKSFAGLEENQLLGLVTVDKMAMMCGFQELYTFNHLTFQEFLAAYYINSLDIKMQTELISKHGKKTEMMKVWKFLCGITRTYYTEANFNHLINRTECGIIFDMQCSFETQQPFTCNSVVAKHGVHHKHEKELNHFTKIISIQFTSQLRIDMNILNFSSSFLTESDFTAMAFVASNAPVHEIELKNCTFGEDGLATLLKKLRHRTKKLHIGANNIRFSGALAEGLQNCKELSVLNISMNAITDAGAGVLMGGLRHCTSLTHLDISYNYIDDDGGKSTAEAMKNWAELRELNLSGNYIGEDGARAILFSAENHCPKLNELKLNISFGKIFSRSVSELRDKLQLHYPQ